MNRTAEGLWQELRDDALVARSADYARWTIPAVFPEQPNFQKSGNQIIEYDYQSMGAMLVNKLASKLTQTLFPTNTSFFKLSLQGLSDQQVDEETQKLVAKLELQACRALFNNAEYNRLTQALRLLIVTGNCLLVREGGQLRVYSLHNYTVKRNSYGEVLDIVLKEKLYMRELDPQTVEQLNMQHMDDMSEVFLFTQCSRKYGDDGAYWEITQSINNIEIVQPSTYPLELCPFIPVVWNLTSTDNYGRGIVEDYAGDFIKLSELSAALTMYELESCNVRYLASPQSTLDLDALGEARTGEVVSGSPDGVQPLELGEFQKIQALSNELSQVFARLAQAFMYTSNQRDAERVTAYEIQMNAIEAEQTLGGVYSQLSHGMHLPLAYLLCYEVNPDFWSQYLAGQWDISIITGMQALGRSAEIQQWLQLTQELILVVPNLQQISPRFNTEKIIDMFMLARGLSPDGVMLTEQELQAKMEALQSQMAQTQFQDRTINSQDASNKASSMLGNI